MISNQPFAKQPARIVDMLLYNGSHDIGLCKLDNGSWATVWKPRIGTVPDRIHLSSHDHNKAREDFDNVVEGRCR